MTEGPSSITPEQREVVQGALAGAQDAGLKIAGLAEVKEVTPTLVGPKDAPTDLGPTVELAVTVDADGRPIPRPEHREPGQVGDSVVTIRVTPHADLGGTFWRANVSVHDVETARLYHGQASGPTSEQWDEIVGDRTDAEYGDDPEATEQLLELQAQSPAEAVTQALAGIVSGGVVDTHKPWDTPAAAAPVTAAGSSPPAGADRGSDEPPVGADGGPPWLLIGGGAALLLALVLLITVFAGGSEDGVPVADADATAPAATSQDGSSEGAVERTDGGSGLPPAPEGADQGTVTVTGDDTCGNFAEVGEFGGGAGPSSEGGRLVVNTGDVGPGGLSGTFWPDGAGGLVWEDRELIAGDVDNPDAQAITDVEVGDGVITGSLEWTDHDDCTSTGEVRLEFPTTVTRWLVVLPPRGPSPMAVEELTIDAVDGRATVTGVLIDVGGGDTPAAGQEVWVRISGHDGRIEQVLATTDGSGGFRVEVVHEDIDPEDDSLSASVLKAGHFVGTVFVEP